MKMAIRRIVSTAFCLAAALATGSACTGETDPPRVPVTEATAIRTVVARGLEHPWGLAFLPDGRMLVSERPGRLRIVYADGRQSAPLAGVPRVDAAGQGGLLDVAIDPSFTANRRIWLSFSDPAPEGGNRTAVARAVLGEAGLSDVKVIFRQAPAVASRQHFGSRLVFDRSGALFVTQGDRGSRRDEAQNRSNLIGKIVRIDTDGQPAAGNPDPASPIWSIGHRNVQGAALHPQSGVLWAHEHGPQGGDEVNIVRAGGNHGWPVATWGREYGTGFSIGKGPRQPGMVDPAHVWVPSIAPSGMAFYTGSRFPQWTGSLFVGALKDRMLVRLQLDGEKVVREERLRFSDAKRIRDVRQGPDGWLYVLTDEDDGEVWRVGPGK
jgi:glucose/arabinose dehydrogenase